MANPYVKRTAHRWRCWLIMLIGVFFAFGSFWLVQVINQAAAKHRPTCSATSPTTSSTLQLRAHDGNRPAALRDLGDA
jgi:hypothetical protein